MNSGKYIKIICIICILAILFVVYICVNNVYQDDTQKEIETTVAPTTTVNNNATTTEEKIDESEKDLGIYSIDDVELPGSVVEEMSKDGTLTIDDDGNVEIRTEKIENGDISIEVKDEDNAAISIDDIDEFEIK